MPSTLLKASTPECRASPSTASDPAVSPITPLATTTARLATSRPESTRRTAAARSDMACKLVNGCDLVNGCEQDALQVGRFRHVQQLRVVRPGTGQRPQLQAAAAVACRVSQHGEKL